MKEYLVVIATELAPLFLLLVGLGFTAAIDPYISAKHRGIMLVIVILAATLIAQNLLENTLAAGPPRPMLRTVVAIYGYSVRPVFLALFLYLVHPGRRHLISWVLVGVNWLIHMTALFSPICFEITPANHYESGPLGTTCLVISLTLLANLLFLSIRSYRGKGKRETLIPVAIAVVIVLSVMLDRGVEYSEQPVTFLTIAIVVSSLFYYIWLHLQFVREHEEDLKARQRIQIMLSQIQPHFLYNTLGAIEDLCDSDPKAAKAATVTFSQYLRGNMASLSDQNTIPFSKELEHTKLYLELEKLRYEDDLQVRYDVACTAFSLPTLTLEPLVENAVRHGVREKRDGRGTVTVSTRAFSDHYEISVADDGPGFDPEAVPSDGEAHVGIQNVRDRLAQLCGGKLVIRSVLGEGTTATIILPREREA